jgi:hypothetical protein
MTCSIQPAIDPSNKMTFLFDWELTKKCNLECDYCLVGIDNGHDNSLPHPDFDDLPKTIDFIFEYANIYMSSKPSAVRHLVLNLYGGEALHHPDIERVLRLVHEKYKSYHEKFVLRVSCTTNLILKTSKLERLLPFIDEFTSSFHPQIDDKKIQLFKDNNLLLKKNNKNNKTLVMMHPRKFNVALEMIEWCKDNDVPYLSRHLDWRIDDAHLFPVDLSYTDEQIDWFNDFYTSKSHNATISIDKKAKQDISRSGRACCGGRSLVLDNKFKERVYYVENSFTGWKCSVNHFFAFVRQATKLIYHGKDCRMTFDGTIGPIGHIDQADKLLEFTRNHVQNNTLPVIECAKPRCYCGTCAPKATTLDEYNDIMKKYYKKI